MKAYRYIIEIVGSLPDKDCGRKHKIEELAIPALGLIITKKGIFLAKHISTRMSNSESMAEVNLPSPLVANLRRIKKIRLTESSMIEKFNFKESVDN